MSIACRQVAAAALLLLAAHTACGSVISLHTRFTTVYRGGRVTLEAHVHNRGTRSAQQVTLEAELDGVTLRSESHHLLPPGETWRTDMRMGAPAGPPGEYLMLIRLHYADHNGQSFHAVRTAPVLTAPEPAPDNLLAITLRRPDGSPERVDALIRNQSDRLQRVTVRLPVPPPLAVTPAATLLSIPPHGEAIAVFKLDGASTLPHGARLTAILDATVDGTHLSRQARLQLPPPQADAQACLRTRYRLTAAAVALLLLSLLTQALPGSRLQRACASRTAARLVTLIVLAAATGILFSIIPLDLLLTDTTLTGGDNPAHNVMVKHLSEQLFRHGRVISWSSAWWGGFPLFQFYFPLPYLVAALLGTLLPLNIAFKCITVAGLVALPFAAWAGARRARLKAPAPALLALAAALFLYDPSHTIWGANIASTLAGMIANSFSFPIMLLVLFSACRDADDGVFRIRTAVLLSLLTVSHFFTTVLTVLVMACLPFVTATGRRRAFHVLLREGLLGLALAAWWLVPLMAKRAYAVDFGTNWDVNPLALFPGPWQLAIPFALLGVIGGIRSRSTAVRALGVLLTGALLLFRFGFSISPVFVNIRLWPFIVFSLLGLAAAGAAGLLQRLRAWPPAAAALLLIVFTWGLGHAVPLRSWARWNYAGMERTPNHEVFNQLVLPLNGTPGRLANDLHETNASLGSSRIFEVVPYRIDKPVLEGGLVNSAAGSLVAYYLQSLTSESHAGAPPMVRPGQLDIERATALLELVNVKHFIARGTTVRAALQASAHWHSLNTVQGWELFELTTHDGGLVRILPRAPLPVRVSNRQAAGLEWLYGPARQEQFFILLNHREPAGPRFASLLTEADLADYRAAVDAGSPPAQTGARIASDDVQIRELEAGNDRIAFRTTGIGKPHLIAVQYFPNWQVHGADRIYMVTPGFMLVYPEQEEVELTYGSTWSDCTGRFLTATAWLLTLAVLITRTYASRRRADCVCECVGA